MRAIKALKEQHGRDLDVCVLRETKLLSSLHHPNIIGLYGVLSGSSIKKTYLMMEICQQVGIALFTYWIIMFRILINIWEMRNHFFLHSKVTFDNFYSLTWPLSPWPVLSTTERVRFSPSRLYYSQVCLPPTIILYNKRSQTCQHSTFQGRRFKNR